MPWTVAVSADGPLRILVVAGGTAGHVAPALEVAGVLAQRGCEVTWVGSAGRAEEDLVPAAGYELDLLPVTWLPRRPGLAQVEALARSAASLVVASRIIRRRRPDAILAAGGYVVAPVAPAARLQRVPVVVTEADAHLGLANRVAMRTAQRLCTTFPIPRHVLAQEVTGRPVAEAFFTTRREEARRQLDLPADDPVVAVVGGSGGARNLNEAAAAAWGSDADPRVAGRPLHVIQVTGRRDWPDFRDVPACDRHRMVQYCTDMPALYAAADLVVSRAGASVFELAASGTPALLVPWRGATQDHQRANATSFAATGAARMLEDDHRLAGSVAAVVAELLAPEAVGELAAMRVAMRALGRRGAQERIAEIVLEYACARRLRTTGTIPEGAAP